MLVKTSTTQYNIKHFQLEELQELKQFFWEKRCSLKSEKALENTSVSCINSFTKYNETEHFIKKIN